MNDLHMIERTRHSWLMAGGLTAFMALSLGAAGQEAENADPLAAGQKPFAGECADSFGPDSLEGTVMCGYQGWFSCEGDAAELGWNHYQKEGRFEPGSCSIDFWPDVSELDPDERYATAFRHADGRVAEVFSSVNPKTVDRHFRWMAEYGIDGAYVQRFVTSTRSPLQARRVNMVLDNCRAAANRNGRRYCVMYDLSGLKEGQIDFAIEDWKRLVDNMGIARDPADKAYMRHRGKPVVAVWGIGFTSRLSTLDEGMRLVDFLKNDPKYGGMTVMLGIPSRWRTLDRDCRPDPKLHEILRMADILSPWNVGRFRTPDQAAEHIQTVWKDDMEWCAREGKEYLPVVFPGFSWHNLKPEAPLNAVPRLGGEFLWRQYAEAARLGVTMIYQAMFDEIDEGTAIFKCTNDPPVGESPFVTYEGLPSDHYLWLVGQGGRAIRGELEVSNELPNRVR